MLASGFNNVLQNELNDTLSETGADVSTKTAAAVATQPMIRHNIIVDIDATAKVNECHDTLSIVSMEPSDEFLSDDEFECVGTDNIVIIKAKDAPSPNISTDLVVYNPKINNHDVSMRSVYPMFYRALMTSDKTHKEIEAEFLRADWITPELFEELYHSAPSLMQTASECNKQSNLERLREFEVKCNFAFPVGRKFANYRQLDSYVTKFLHAWKIVKHRDGNSFKCFFAETNRRSESKMFSKTKTTQMSLFKNNTV